MNKKIIYGYYIKFLTIKKYILMYKKKYSKNYRNTKIIIILHWQVICVKIVF
jgi:hypothetical protein